MAIANAHLVHCYISNHLSTKCAFGVKGKFLFGWFFEEKQSQNKPAGTSAITHR
jgi:hypothetical protein